MEAENLLVQAWEQRRLGNYQQTLALVQQVHENCAADDHLTLGRIHHIYMQVESDHGRLPKAREFCQLALSHYHDSGDPHKIAHCTRHLADLQRESGMPELAADNYRKALEIYRQQSGVSPLDLANALRGYGLLMINQEDKPFAISLWEEIRDLYSSLGLSEGVAEADEKLELLGK